jgi:NLR family CARD domain-containing protein 3
MEYLNLGSSTLTNAGINTVLGEASESLSLLYLCLKSIHPQPKSGPSVSLGQEHARLQKLLQEHVFENVRNKYGGLNCEEWERSEKRLIISNQLDVRKLDSVYRNRDMGLARRRLKNCRSGGRG